LETLHAKFKAALNDAVAEENARWQGKGPVSVSPELVGLRPAGSTPENSPLVQAAITVSHSLGLPVHLGEGSTDANVPMNPGIPAITIGGGGSGAGFHSLNETYDTTGSAKGTQRALLLVLALVR
jgi:di/tripeptidase